MCTYSDGRRTASARRAAHRPSTVGRPPPIASFRTDPAPTDKSSPEWSRSGRCCKRPSTDRCTPPVGRVVWQTQWFASCRLGSLWSPCATATWTWSWPHCGRWRSRSATGRRRFRRTCRNSSRSARRPRAPPSPGRRPSVGRRSAPNNKE